jgi:hypothetical protein
MVGNAKYSSELAQTVNDVILCMCCIIEHGEKSLNSLQI